MKKASRQRNPEKSKPENDQGARENDKRKPSVLCGCTDWLTLSADFVILVF
jgi:hypothetical protein